MNPQINQLLNRQLKKLNLERDSLPEKLEDWHALLQKVDNTYSEVQQERYILERSMEISSNEVMDLNSKLSQAQNMAAMGYWSYNKANNKFYWSNDSVHLLGSDFTGKAISLENFIENLDNDVQDEVKKKFDEVLQGGEKKEFEAAINTSKFSGWFHFMLSPVKVNNSIDVGNITGVVIDITIRKNYALEVEKLNKQLISSARVAGRADIATSILHNIGNVLNSVNTSVSVVEEVINQDDVERLNMAIGMMEDNLDNIGKFILEDEKGKLLPSYLIMLIKEVSRKKDLIKAESSRIHRHLEHVKSIISSQQSLAKTSTVKTKVQIAPLIKVALDMTGINFNNHNIKIINNCDCEKEIYTDESKLTQIIVNLIANAKDAILIFYDKNHVLEGGEILLESKIIDDSLIIQVKDNGIGINQSDLDNLFTFGFTTKVDGHGFGLHSSILAAKEINGTLEAKSEGINKGCMFILTIDISGDKL